LAAEWLLLCSISRVYVFLAVYLSNLINLSPRQSRTPPILPLTLTISSFPSDPLVPSNHIPSLSHILSQIFPLITTLPLSLETLNSTNFGPESKNEDLHSGWLQVPSGTVLLVTESGVTEGGVLERGEETSISIFIPSN